MNPQLTSAALYVPAGTVTDSTRTNVSVNVWSYARCVTEPDSKSVPVSVTRTCWDAVSPGRRLVTKRAAGL